MSFRESVSYSKDLITGRKIEVIKNKPIDTVARGVFTVELFDSVTGKKTYEAKSENRVSAVFANSSYLDGYFYPLLDNVRNNDMFSANGGGSGDHSSYSSANWMLLTTGDIPEDPYDYWTWGSIVGQADLRNVYAGTDILRGTVNQNESKRIENYANGVGTVLNSVTRHWVVDFPTSAGNGTFRSIYLTGGSYYSFNFNKLYGKKVFQSSNNQYFWGSVTDESYIYGFQNDGKIKIWDKKTWVVQTDKSLISSKSICYDKYLQVFWTLDDYGNFKKLDKNFQVLQSYTKSSGVDIIDGVTNTNDRTFFDICATENYILQTFNVIINGTYKSVLVVYTKDGVFVRNITLKNIGASPQRSCVYEIPNGKIRVEFDGNSEKTVVLNKADLSIYCESEYVSYRRGSRWDFDLNNIIYCGGSGGQYINIAYVVPSGTHTLLPEPITKTPTNTMKIQYDLTVDYVYPLDMPSH